MQTAFYRRLQARGRAAGDGSQPRCTPWRSLDAVVERIARRADELLAPAIDRVWHDEIGALRRDLRLWVDEIARAGGEWMPLHFEWAFGYQDGGALAVGAIRAAAGSR